MRRLFSYPLLAMLMVCLGLSGCRQPAAGPTVNPFGSPATIPPPGTGQAGPTNIAPPYYQGGAAPPPANLQPAPGSPGQQYGPPAGNAPGTYPGNTVPGSGGMPGQSFPPSTMPGGSGTRNGAALQGRDGGDSWLAAGRSSDPTGAVYLDDNLQQTAASPSGSANRNDIQQTGYAEYSHSGPGNSARDIRIPTDDEPLVPKVGPNPRGSQAEPQYAVNQTQTPPSQPGHHEFRQQVSTVHEQQPATQTQFTVTPSRQPQRVQPATMASVQSMLPTRQSPQYRSPSGPIEITDLPPRGSLAPRHVNTRENQNAHRDEVIPAGLASRAGMEGRSEPAAYGAGGDAQYGSQAGFTTASPTPTASEGPTPLEPRSRFGYDTDYRWLSGRLEYSQTLGQWKIRYIPIDGDTDSFGGSVIIANIEAVEQLEPGDFIQVQGQLSGTATENDSAPRYRVTRIARL